MKIRCRECGTKFRYESNSGLCPKCMEYNPWSGDGQPPRYSGGNRFMMWLAGVVAVSALAASPVIYEARRERQLVWEEYERELESESEGPFSEEVAQGKPIRAGEFYVTPEAGIWIPKAYTVGLTDNGNWVFIVPVHVAANEDSPKDRQIDFRLESEGIGMKADDLSYSVQEYWPGLKGELLSYGYIMKPEKERQYLVFETEEKPESLKLCVEESISQPDTYETTVTKIYKTPLTVITEEDAESESLKHLLENVMPSVRTAEAGNAFDYFDSRLVVTKLRRASRKEVQIPDGKQLIAAAVRRESGTWPNTGNLYAFTAMVSDEGEVFSNARDWTWEEWLDTDLSDLWGYYYQYNYRADSKSQKEKENPDTVYQCYLIDEDETELELVFPAAQEGDGSLGYCQIRVPVKLPAEGETITYETGTVPAKGRLRR